MPSAECFFTPSPVHPITPSSPLAITGMGLICRRKAALCSRFIDADSLPAQNSNARSLELALYASKLAGAEEFSERESTGTCVTISKGWLEELERRVERGGSGGHVLQCAPDFAAREIARRFRFGGPSAAAVAACASGLASLKLGGDWIRDGVCKTVLSGAGESSNSELVLKSFERLGVMSRSGFTRPFDRRRDGFVVGEGAAVFRLEALHEAQRRGADVLGIIWRIALGADGCHLTTPDPSGDALAEVITRACQGHRDEIGWVHAHGTATEYNDRVEAAALRRVFGKKIPPVTATKGMTGHLLGASGAVALGLTLEALRGGFIPCVAGLEEVDAEFSELDLVLRESRRSAARKALVLNHGFGGHIAAAVVGL